jgi:hypothetical protein
MYHEVLLHGSERAQADARETGLPWHLSWHVAWRWSLRPVVLEYLRGDDHKNPVKESLLAARGLARRFIT